MPFENQVWGADLVESEYWGVLAGCVTAKVPPQTTQRLWAQRRQKYLSPSDADILVFFWQREDGRLSQSARLSVKEFHATPPEDLWHRIESLPPVEVVEAQCYSCERTVGEVRKVIHGPGTNICNSCVESLIAAKHDNGREGVTSGHRCPFCGRTSAQVEPIYALAEATMYTALCKDCIQVLEGILKE